MFLKSKINRIISHYFLPFRISSAQFPPLRKFDPFSTIKYMLQNIGLITHKYINKLCKLKSAEEIRKEYRE